MNDSKHHPFISGRLYRFPTRILLCWNETYTDEQLLAILLTQKLSNAVLDFGIRKTLAAYEAPSVFLEACDPLTFGVRRAQRILEKMGLPDPAIIPDHIYSPDHMFFKLLVEERTGWALFNLKSIRKTTLDLVSNTWI